MPTPVPDPAILRYHGQVINRDARVIWSEHPAEDLMPVAAVPMLADGTRMVTAHPEPAAPLFGYIEPNDYVDGVVVKRSDARIAATVAIAWAAVPYGAEAALAHPVVPRRPFSLESLARYVPYPHRDGIVDCFDHSRELQTVSEPVNQFGYTAPWRRQLAAAAAGLDLAWSGRYLSQNTATRTVVAQLMDGLIGSAWQQMGLWEGRHNAAITDAWQAEKPHVERRVDAVRAAVARQQPDRWARLVAARIDVPAFAARLNAGQVPTLVASPTGRWQPGTSIVSVSVPAAATADERTAAVSAFHAGLATAARSALEYHDASHWEHDHSPFTDDRHD